MQLIKRLKSLALAVIALAFAQTALAATFPGTTTDVTCAPSSEYAYYTDGTTTYKFTAWTNILKAVGWDVGTGSKVSGVGTPGGTVGDPLVVKIYNYRDIPENLGCEILDDGNGGKLIHVLSRSRYAFDYVTYEFHNCDFLRSTSNNNNYWGHTNTDRLGLKIKFFDCIFGSKEGEGCIPIYDHDDGSQMKNSVDYEFNACTIYRFSNDAASRLFAGACCGDLLVTNCTLDAFVAPDNLSKGFHVKNSQGQVARLTVKDCRHSKRLMYKIGWTTCADIRGFSHYDVGGFMDENGKPVKMLFFRSDSCVEYKQYSDFGVSAFILDKDGHDADSANWKAIESCSYNCTTPESVSAYFECVVPARLVYDANGGTGAVPPPSDEGYDYRDNTKSFTVMSPEDSEFLKDGCGVESWNTKADGTGVTPVSGLIQNGSQGNTNLVLYAIYGNKPKQTGWYTITGIHKVDQYKEGGCSLDDIKTIRYPWYSGIHYITNVYDRVTATYAGGDLPTDDDAHPEVSWANCGGIITLNDGSTYTNQLQVKIFPKTGTTGEQLRIDTSDYIPETPRATHNLHLYYASKTDAKYAKFVFENCYMAHNAKVDNSFKSEIPLDWSGCCGVAFAMRHCTAECGFYVLRASTMLAEHHPVDLEYSSVTFICEDDIDNWHLNAGLWNGDFLMTNCFFDAKVRVSTQHCGDGQDMGIYEGGSGQTLWEVSLCDSFGGTTECVISNNTWRYVMPGYRIFSINRPWNQYIGENTYSPEGGAARPITMDVKDNGGDDDRKENVTSDTMSSGDTPSSGLYYFKYFVHGHEVKFVETDDESKLDDPEVAKTTYYVLDGDSLNEANFWSKENWDDNSEKTVDLTRRNRSVPEGDWNNAVTGKSLSEDLGTTVKKDITYFLGTVTPKNPELVGTLKMPSFVKGHEPTTPSGLSWRVGENGTLYPLLVGSGESPLASECEYYIFSDPNTTEGGIPATLENLKKLDAGDGAGKDYYIRGIVTDFSEEGLTHAPLVSAPAKFTVVNPEHSEYYDFMFVDWIETTDCQYLDTLIDPAQNGVTNFGFALDFVDDCFFPSSCWPDSSDAHIIGSSTRNVKSTSDDWSGFILKNYQHNRTYYGPEKWNDTKSEYGNLGDFAEGQFNFCNVRGSNRPFKFEQAGLTNNVRLQIVFTNLQYSISSSDPGAQEYGTNWLNWCRNSSLFVSNYSYEKMFCGNVYLAATHTDNAANPEGYRGQNHNMHFYGLRFYNGTELIYEGIPAIEKSTGHRGLLRINGNKGDTFIYSETYTNGLDIVTNTATKAKMYVANLGVKVKGPLGLNEFNAPLLDFGTHLAQECGCFEVSAPSDKVAVTLEKQIEDRLLAYAVEETPGAQFIGTKGMTNATFTVLYATKGLAEEQDWTNTVVNANLADPTTATLGNGSLQLFDDNNWSAEPPANEDTFKVVVLTAVSKPVVRTVTVTRGITVTLDANGGKYGDGEETATLVAMPGEPMADLTDDQIPTKAGYTFIGYYDAKEGGTKYYNADGTSAKNCDLADGATLYAHWIKEGFEVLPYLNFDGTHFIVTEYVPNESTWARAQMRVNGEFEPTLPEYPTHVMFGQYEQDDGRVRDWAVSLNGGQEFGLYGWITGKKSIPAIGKGWYIRGKITTPTTVTLGNAGFWREDEKSETSIINGGVNGFPCTATIAIGGANNALPSGHTDDKPGYGVPVRPFDAYTGGLDVFTLQIYESEGGDPEAAEQTLMHDFIPAKRTSDDVEGLYDLVKGEFYPLQTQKIFKLDANGGTQPTSWVYAISENSLPSVAVPTRPGYTFQGYYTARDGGDQIYKEDGNPKAEFSDMEDDQTIYAQWQLACPVELFIAAHAHTADDYVYLAVQPSFKPELTPTAFADWLNGAKEAFRVCASDDGETFDTAARSDVTLEDSGEHKYDADVAKGWVWMKVNISAAKDAGKKYWKAMFLTPAPESAD